MTPANDRVRSQSDYCEGPEQFEGTGMGRISACHIDAETSHGDRRDMQPAIGEQKHPAIDASGSPPLEIAIAQTADQWELPRRSDGHDKEHQQPDVYQHIRKL